MKLPRFPFLPPQSAPDRHHTLIDVDAIQRTLRDAFAAAKLEGGVAPVRVVAETLRRAFAVPDAAAAAAEPAEVVVPDGSPPRRSTPPLPGEVVSGVHVGAAGSRGWRLYVPSRASNDAMPLVVMLHGCTQSPDDFAAGTRMDELAERDGFYVVYPAQSPNANGSKCWNWFRSQDQARDGGEPSLIAGIVRDIGARRRVDPDRIYVAGLSAGAAMAVILGNTHPELFAAVGVHSGLPYGAAHDVASAFAAMGAAGLEPAGAAVGRFVPTIVFHGDRDTTVHAGNGDVVTAQALQRFAIGAPDAAPLRVSVTEGRAGAGARYTRNVHRDAAGRPCVEQWVVHGAGHAWSGGSAQGSYTWPDGPDASAAMTDFFLAQAQQSRA